MTTSSTTPAAQRYPELELFARQMTEAALDRRVIDAFGAMYARYRAGETGKVPWAEVEQPRSGDIVPYAELTGRAELAARGGRLLEQLVVIRLNGGLGTTMKLDRAKSLITVRDGQTFLDLTVRQVLALRAATGVAVPWLAMNSFRTRADCQRALAGFPELAVRGLPVDFLQNMVPRIDRATHRPATLAGVDPEENWAPPGHGDVYLALWGSGLLERLLAAGIRWAFVANVDNLGATVDPRLLGYLDERGVEFAMEVTDKSLADVKGGTLIRRGGRLTLLEGAQVEPEHVADFQDIKVFSVFNTNNLWWRLDALLERLQRGALELPMIVNPKQVAGTEVVQLESAMGAGIGSFERAVGIHVPRERFAPVKATCDLLALRSDVYTLDGGYGIRPTAARAAELGPPVIVLDDRYYKGAPDFEARCPHPLSLLACRRLVVEGDLRFGRGVRIDGDVMLRNGAPGGEQRLVPDGAVLGSGTHVF